MTMLGGTFTGMGFLVRSRRHHDNQSWFGFVLTAATLILAKTAVLAVGAVDERAILTRFYIVSDGDRWINNTNWMDDSAPICSWHGISCAGGDHKSDANVSKIELEGNNLNGKVSKLIYELPHLKLVHLKNNALSDGGFEAWSDLPDKRKAPIRVLDFADNSLTSMKGIGNAPTTLHEFHLSQNRVEELRGEFFKLTDLKLAFLSFNRMVGKIPTTIGNMKGLKELYTYGNKLTGTIPTELGLLDKLEVVTFAENLLSGTLPTELNNLHNIRTFSVHNRDENSGSLKGPLLSFSKSPYLDELYLDSNSLTGPIPDDLMWSSNMTDEIVSVGLTNNKLTGLVPQQLLRFEELNIGLTGNRFKGYEDDSEDEFCERGAWNSGMVESFGCDAIMCGPNTYNQYGRQIGAMAPCVSCDNPDSSDLRGVYGSTVCEQSKLYDWQILATFFTKMDGPNWFNKTGWDVLEKMLENANIEDLDGSALNFCKWHGISCTGDGTVGMINLETNNLLGVVPSQVFELPKIKKLDLQNNDILMDPDDGFNPLAKTSTLTTLQLSRTRVSTLYGLGAATSLENLYLNLCQNLDQYFLDEVFTLKNLKHLEVAWSGLTGPLNPNIGNLRNLERLKLFSNHFTGDLPTELGKLTKLTFLDLAVNAFNGTLPTELMKLTSLTEFHLHQGDFVLVGPLLPFDTMPDLKILSLDHNALTGSIPSTFLGSNTQDAFSVGLSHNKLKGEIPATLAAFDDLDIRLEGNAFASISPDLCTKQKWMDGEVGRLAAAGGNGCDAIVCPKNTWNLHGKATTNSSCLPCDENSYMGATFCGEENPNPEKNILDLLYRKTGGRDWLKQENWDKPGVPICSRQGVECKGSKNDDSGVAHLMMALFGLKGKVPTEIYQLPSLQMVDFTANGVNVFFDGIEAATNLQTMLLSNTDIYTLNGISKAPNSLTMLHLSDTLLSGEIPGELFQLSKLQHIVLNMNSLAGPIHRSISGMSSLQVLIMSNNDLTGPLPSEIGAMTSLKKVVLDNNFLSGNIPTSIEKLVDLEILSLAGQESRKKITGKLPSFAANKKLTTLNLNDNDLTGEIPTDFLDGADVTVPRRIELTKNRIRGPVRIELKRFQKMFIDLTGNRIVDIDPNFCSDGVGDWMDGKVKEFGKSCDAILCPPGTSVVGVGRQVDANHTCQACPNGKDDAPYYGALKCVSEAELFERSILKALYDKLNGTNWIEQTNWLTEKNVCTWFGVKCDETGLIELNLEENGLESINEDTAGVSFLLFSFPEIKKIDIKGNRVPLNLTFIPHASKLQQLKLSTTGLKSAAGISNAKDLRRVHLTNNDLKGRIPSELFTLTNMRSLYLSFNDFTSSIPPELGNLSNLEELYIFGNMITGSIPGSAIAKLTNMKEFIMADNKLSGELPTQFGSLPKLQQLSLYGQSSDALINGNLPDFANAPELWYLDVTDNDMSGTIPSTFLSNSNYVDDKEGLTIYLGNNEFEGVLPSSLSKFFAMDIDVTGNFITGVPSILCEKSPWMGGEVGEVKSCAAIACKPGFYSEIGRQQDPDTPCSPCEALEGSGLWGQRECESFDSERDTLLDIYFSTQGSKWFFSTGWNTDEPICSWEGVLCSSGKNDDAGVVEIDLSGNGLNGTLPPSVFSDLPLLKSFNVKDNSYLSLPLDQVSNGESLELLYLSNINIDTVDGVVWPPNLRELHLTANGLTGTLPDGILDLGDTLEELYIAFNFFSGELPTRIGEMKAMKEWYSYDNDFSGQIPTEIGRMTSLVVMVLAENLISGTIPTEFSSLPNLNLFSCFRRFKPGPKLTGQIPDFDKNPQLTDLYLDHNLLSGTIPTRFLSSAKGATLVILSHNNIAGMIPEELDSIPELSLQIEGNRITAYPPKFCDNKAWMNGQLGKVGCNAFLCPPYFASPIGRANETLSCQKCQIPEAALFYGSLSCDVPLAERTILQQLFDETGGPDWHKKGNWGTEASVCNWHGVHCEGKTELGPVEEIVLGGNNLVGAPPDTLMQLSRLKTLWLYSNPIDFSFENIGAATQLTDLRLDATKVSRFDGLENAKSLTVLEMRFNKHTGTFPTQILELSNLRELYLGFNAFTGTLPDLSRLRYLRKFHAENNQFTGSVPPFDTTETLRAVDLSQNRFGGQLPHNLFERTPTRANLFLDVSSNNLKGEVPKKLDRFQTMEIYLRDNAIDFLPSVLCNNIGWNGRDVENYGCDGILCGPGTYNSAGRRKDGLECMDCLDDGPPIFGRTTCSAFVMPPASSAVRMTVVPAFVKISIVPLLFAALLR